MPFILGAWPLELFGSLLVGYPLVLVFIYTGKLVFKVHHLPIRSIPRVALIIIIAMGVVAVAVPEMVFRLYYQGADGGPGGLLLMTAVTIVVGLLTAIVLSQHLLGRPRRNCTTKERWLISLWAFLACPALLIGAFVTVVKLLA